MAANRGFSRGRNSMQMMGGAKGRPSNGLLNMFDHFAETEDNDEDKDDSQRIGQRPKKTSFAQKVRVAQRNGSLSATPNARDAGEETLRTSISAPCEDPEGVNLRAIVENMRKDMQSLASATAAVAQQAAGRQVGCIDGGGQLQLKNEEGSEVDREGEDIFGQLSSHIMSVQCLLNKHSDRSRKLWQAQTREVDTLKKENQQLKGRLEHVMAACFSPEQELKGVAPSSLQSPRGETGASSSNGAFGDRDLESNHKLHADAVDDSTTAVPSTSGEQFPPGYTGGAHSVVREDYRASTITLTLPDGCESSNLLQVCPEDDAISEGASEQFAGGIGEMEPDPHYQGLSSMAANTSEKPFKKAFSKTLSDVVFGEKTSRPSTASGAVQEFDDDRILSIAAPKPVFADAAAMKEKVRQAIGKPCYDVADFYTEEGFCPWLATHPRFEQATLCVIAFNAIWIAVDADLNDQTVLSKAKPEFIIAENFFCSYFLAELLVRFCAFKNKRDCGQDSWFVFDSCLVLMMVCETWIMNFILELTGASSGDGLGNASILRLLRLLRLTRMARMARLLKAMPELMILVKGMSVAMRSVFFTLCLLGIIIYLFSIAFRQITDGLAIGDRYFKSVPEAMTSLLLRGALPDVADLVYEVSDESPWLGVLLCFFILFASLTVMNMLVGVLCEVVSVVSAVEKETLVVNFVQNQLQSLLQHHCNPGGEETPMSKEEFTDLLSRPQAARALNEVGVDVLGLMEIADFLFKDGKTLNFPDFMEMVLELRGSNTATVKHIVDLQRFVHLELRRTKVDMERHVDTVLLSMNTAESGMFSSEASADNRITNHGRPSAISMLDSANGLIGVHSAGGVMSKIKSKPKGACIMQVLS